MPLTVLGINHRSAPLSLREQLAIGPDQHAAALDAFAALSGVDECALLSTCNRTEVVIAGQGDVRACLAELGNIAPAALDAHLYQHHDEAALRHLFRVASGLDSMVLGEPQILGQLKGAYHSARAHNALGARLERVFQSAFSAAKRVRNETAIGAESVSVASVSVGLAKRIFADFEKHQALLVGSGEMIELLARHLQGIGIGGMVIANRNIERASALAAEFGAIAIGLDDITEHLKTVDLVFASTASPAPLIDLAMTKAAFKTRKHRPMFMCDLAVPRDIAPDVSKLNDVYLYSVDDLQQIAAEGQSARQAAALDAERIISLEAAQLAQRLDGLTATQLIRQLREDGQQQRDTVLAKAQQRLAADGDAEAALQWLAHSLTQRLLHQPTSRLSAAANADDQALLLAATELFDLQTTTDDSTKQPNDSDKTS